MSGKFKFNETLDALRNVQRRMLETLYQDV